MTRTSRPIIAGVGLGIVTFVSYLPGLHRSLDFDSAETVGLFIREGPPWAVFKRQAVFNNHPFFSFLEQLVRVVTGRSDAAAMRILPIACGAAAVGLVAWYAARRFSLVAGVIAAAFVAANPMMNELSREVRGYSLVALCALVSTLVVIEELIPRPGERSAFGRWSGVWYVASLSIGLATHLYMGVVAITHVGMVLAAGRLDESWRKRFLGAAVLSLSAYAAMAGTMRDAGRAMLPLLQPRFPIDVAEAVLGGGYAALIVLPVIAVGLSIAARNRVVLGGAIAFAATFTLVWLAYRSPALTTRYFVFLVPLAGLALAVAIARAAALLVVTVSSAALAALSLVNAYTAEPTAYRQAAQVIHDVKQSGGRACVSPIGVPQMKAYAEESRDFIGISHPEDLDECDVVLVVAWWQTDASWYQDDREVLAEAPREFDTSTVLPAGDRALVFSRGPLSRWTDSS